MTGKALLWTVPRDFLQAPLTQQLTTIDQQLSACWIAIDQNIEKGQLLPLPLLGIPGWYQANEQESFYNNVNYFRPLASFLPV